MSVKKIFEGDFDEEIHSSFLKFGKGDYSNKFLLEGKKQADKWVIKTDSEYVNFLVKAGLEKAKENLDISGVIVSTSKLDIPISKDLKQFMGVKQYKISGEFEPTLILELMKKYPRAFFALSFSFDGLELKVKAKAPKSAKPSTSGGKPPKADFCTLKTSDEDIVKELFFDVPNFKKIEVTHTIKVEQIIYPKDFAKMKPEEVRENSKRKGVLIREITVNDRFEKREANFEA